MQNAFLITISGDRDKAAIWLLNHFELGSQTICLQAIPARMSCDNVLDWVGGEVVKECKNLADNRGLQGCSRSVHQVGAGSDGVQFGQVC